MPNLPTLNVFLHSSSLLLSAYPTSRITTKYTLPPPPPTTSTKETTTTTTTETTTTETTTKKDPSATLTAKVYHPQSGICLKYSTDKAQEVGRLITSLGKLARGEAIEVPTVTATTAAGGVEGDVGDKMDVDSGGLTAVKAEDPVAVGGAKAGSGQQQQQAQQGGGGAGGKKKKKGKR